MENNTAEAYPCSGVLDIITTENGFYGYLRNKIDCYVTGGQIYRLGLRKGDYVSGYAKKYVQNSTEVINIDNLSTFEENSPINISSLNKTTDLTLLRADTVNGQPYTEDLRDRDKFDDLTPVFPNSQIIVENDIINTFCPIGYGSRGLIVAPPMVGKTRLLKSICGSVPKTPVILLIGERPEEVTDFHDCFPNAQIFSTTFDDSPKRMLEVADLAIEYCKRQVELGEDIILLTDSITRLVRASNEMAPSGGRIMTGGLDSTAYAFAKKLFGSARNIKEGGSLTILATILVNTGSAMDDVIYQELKSTSNMQLVLNSSFAQKGLYPAIDVSKSLSRNSELIYNPSYGKVALKTVKYVKSKGIPADFTLDFYINKCNSDIAKFITEIPKISFSDTVVFPE